MKLFCGLQRCIRFQSSTSILDEEGPKYYSAAEMEQKAKQGSIALAVQVSTQALKKQWVELAEISKYINPIYFRKIKFRRMMADAIAENSNFQAEHSPLDFQRDLIPMLNTMSNLQFEPRGRTESDKKELHNSVPFYRQVVKILECHRQKGKVEQVVEIARFLVHLNRQAFLPYRQMLEEFIMHKLKKKESLGKIKRLVVHGQMVAFWSIKFQEQIYRRSKGESSLKDILNIFQFSMFDRIPTKISTRQQVFTRTASHEMEEAIFEMLYNLHYNVEANVIFHDKIEVDILIGNKIVVEANGFQHYILNSASGTVLRRWDEWRQAVLRKRGFLISNVRYDDWVKCAGSEEKMRYLINAIEGEILRHQKTDSQV